MTLRIVFLIFLILIIPCFSQDESVTPPTEGKPVCTESAGPQDSLQLLDPEGRKEANQLFPEAESLVESYLSKYAEQYPFYGVRFKGRLAEDIDDNELFYQARIEWDLFQDGWKEAKKHLVIKSRQEELQLLQLLNDLKNHRLNEELDRLQGMENTIRSVKANKLLHLFTALEKRRRIALEQGLISRDLHESVLLQKQRAELEVELYKHATMEYLDEDSLEALYQVEYMELLPLKTLLSCSLSGSYPLKIQDNLIARASTPIEWTDELSVNLFAERVKTYNSIVRNTIGVEVDVPLQAFSQRKKLQDQNIHFYEAQKEVLEKRIERNLKKMIDYYNFQQFRLRSKVLSIHHLKQRLSEELEKAEAGLPILEDTPEQTAELLGIEIMRTKFELLEIRLKIYEILLKLGFYADAQSINDLLTDHQADSSSPLVGPSEHVSPSP
jgi:hypothetical protein